MSPVRQQVLPSLAPLSILAMALAGRCISVQGLPTCPDCSKIPTAAITACSKQMVCGQDQNTYASACLAICQGIEIEHAGSCDAIEDNCPRESGDTDNQQQAALGTASAERITYFTEQDLRKFEGFMLLGKAEQKTGVSPGSDTRGVQEGSKTRSKRHAPQLVMTGDNLHVSDMPSPAPERELAPSGPIHSDRSPEKSSSEIPTAEPTQLDTSADNLQHASHLEGHKPQSTFHDWLQHGKAMFQRLIGWEQSSQTDMKSHSMATNKGMRGLKAIIGEDNRAPVSSAEYPYTAIGQLRYTEAGTGAGFLCTGTLFSDRHVLTNAHCIYDRTSAQFHSGWEFVPGLDQGREPFGRVNYDFYDIYTDGYTSNFKNWDLAIITLAEPVGQSTGWMGIKSLPPAGTCTGSPLVLENLHTVGYPVEATASSTAYQDVCNLNVRNGCKHDASAHTCDTKVGNSGSPLFQADGINRSKWLIRAVHFAGLKDSAYNLAIPIDDTIFQWIDCYRAGNTACLANDLMPVIS